MEYAEVSVNSPVAQRRMFSYTIPSGLTIDVGQAVLVPFGDKLLQGIVLELSHYPLVEETREIADVIETRPLISSFQVSLARWLSEYYLSPLFNAVALMLPPGFERKVVTFVSSSSIPHEQDTSSLTPRQEDVFELVGRQGKISLRELERKLGARQARIITSKLIAQGLVVKSYELERVKVKPKKVRYLRLVVKASEARQEAARLRGKRAIRQAALLDFLAHQSEAVPLAEVRQRVSCDKAVADALVSKGLAKIEPIEVKREPISYESIALSYPLTLTKTQKSAFNSIKSSLMSAAKGNPQPNVFLLRGVTGSGKTEIYLQALAEAVRLGKRGIVLVPEIALTAQTIERFASRFPHKVAVLHSKLSLGEQFDEWQRIRDGEFDVVIGSRSAIFAPQPDLGIIVIDEEHEWTYKQHDKSPGYHARDVAMKLAELTGAVVILGSATPDVETFYHAQIGDYRLLELSERVTPGEGSPLPQVKVVDLRQELKAGNRSLFSRSLSRATAKAVTNGEQVILFLNRRGAATFIQCRSCGFVLRCKRCDVTLTYHLTQDVLVCHQCNYRTSVPQICPQCLSRRIKFLGIGTQKLEQETSFTFPQARLLRWDSDVARGKYSHREILGKLRAHEADILIGTQMIAKGLDLPLVTLVGVVCADTALNLPDFRAGENTFQLMSQVAGRAGRGSLGGQVILQTYSPEHYAIKAAAKHDYALFYNQEINYRRQLYNPPFSQLASLVYSHANEALCQREAERMKRLLIEERDSRGIANLSLIGPAPAFIHRLRGRYRWQIIVRGAELSAFLSPIPVPQGWIVDINPVGLK
ncbi:MAG TPA: primosomal protein N' [Dehalococcoidia bacterium]|nr:primosomal protein N' [Dehalococcoidia bacterium]